MNGCEPTDLDRKCNHSISLQLYNTPCNLCPLEKRIEGLENKNINLFEIIYNLGAELENNFVTRKQFEGIINDTLKPISAKIE